MAPSASQGSRVRQKEALVFMTVIKEADVLWKTRERRRKAEKKGGGMRGAAWVTSMARSGEEREVGTIQ
jgi:hypothetical protein